MRQQRTKRELVATLRDQEILITELSLKRNGYRKFYIKINN
jgi:hypothetical protein